MNKKTFFYFVLGVAIGTLVATKIVAEDRIPTFTKTVFQILHAGKTPDPKLEEYFFRIEQRETGLRFGLKLDGDKAVIVGDMPPATALAIYQYNMLSNCRSGGR